MAQLRQEYGKFVARNAEVIAVGPENKKRFSDWWRRHQMPFIGIPDPEHAIADAYGQQVKLLKFGRMPAMVLIDEEGMIRYRHYGESMSDITPDEETLRKLDELNIEQAK